MAEVFTNKDAEFLAALSKCDMSVEFSNDLQDYNALPEKIRARLLTIARNLQKMDDRSTSSYSRGFADGRASTSARSNLVQSSAPPNLEAALEAWKGEVTTLPSAVKVEHKDTLTADDLEFD